MANVNDINDAANIPLDDLMTEIEAAEINEAAAKPAGARLTNDELRERLARFSATPSQMEQKQPKNIKETALQLVSLGFIVAPSMPCGTTDRNDPSKPAKNPVGAWKDSTKPSYCICKSAEDVERLWKKHPRSNVGVFCGGESGIYCLDIDRKQNQDGFAALREIGHDLEAEIPPTIVSRTPSGGWHVYFKCSGQRKIWETQGVLVGVDIRGECTKGGLGGFAVEAPSCYQIPATKEVKHYEWIHSPSEHSIMECPDWLLDLADKATQREKRMNDKKVQDDLPKQEKPAEGPLFDEDSPAFKAAVVALTRMHESIGKRAKVSGHQPEDVMMLAVRLCRFNYGLNREASWKALNTKPSPEGKSWNERCKKADGETQWKWTREKFDHKFDDVEATPEKVHFMEDAEQKEESAPPPDEANGEEEAPTEEVQELNWLDVLDSLQGLVGDIARYAYSTMIRPQPKFAVLIGFITAATIYNRTIHDSAHNLAHLFAVAVCPNGGGKDPVLKVPKEIIKAALSRLGWSACLTMAKAHSESAIADELNNNHAVTMLIDEVAGFFKQAKAGERNGASIATIKGALKELYSYQLGQTYEGAKNARVQGKSQKRIRVDTPCVSFAGVTQDDVLPDAFQEEDVRDGLIPRIVFFISSTRPKKNIDAIENRPQIPEELVERVAAIFACQKWQHPNKEDLRFVCYADEFDSVLIESEEEAKKLQRDFGEFCDEQFEKYEGEGKLTASNWVRADENARRFALIYAAGRGYDRPHEEKITAADVTLTTNIITACTIDSCRFLEGRIADDKFDKLKVRILGFVNRSPDKARTQTEITRGKYGDPKPREAAINDLKAAGLLRVGSVCRNGRSATAYFITKAGEKSLG